MASALDISHTRPYHGGMTTKAELLSMIAEVPMDRKIVFQMGHLAEVGDLLEPVGIDTTATIDSTDSTVINLEDPYWTDSAYNADDEG